MGVGLRYGRRWLASGQVTSFGAWNAACADDVESSITGWRRAWRSQRTGGCDGFGPRPHLLRPCRVSGLAIGDECKSPSRQRKRHVQPAHNNLRQSCACCQSQSRKGRIREAVQPRHDRTGVSDIKCTMRFYTTRLQDLPPQAAERASALLAAQASGLQPHLPGCRLGLPTHPTHIHTSRRHARPLSTGRGTRTWAARRRWWRSCWRRGWRGGLRGWRGGPCP